MNKRSGNFAVGKQIAADQIALRQKRGVLVGNIFHFVENERVDELEFGGNERNHLRRLLRRMGVAQ